jgi:hypothetical protein
VLLSLFTILLCPAPHSPSKLVEQGSTYPHDELVSAICNSTTDLFPFNTRNRCRLQRREREGKPPGDTDPALDELSDGEYEFKEEPTELRTARERLAAYQAVSSCSTGEGHEGGGGGELAAAAAASECVAGALSMDFRTFGHSAPKIRIVGLHSHRAYCMSITGQCSHGWLSGEFTRLVHHCERSILPTHDPLRCR